MKRFASDKEKEKPTPVLKDNDWTDKQRTIKLGPDARTRFLEILERDVAVRYTTLARTHTHTHTWTPQSPPHPHALLPPVN